LWLIFFSLFKLWQYLVREQADVFHRHVVGHAAEVEGAGNRRQPDFLAPFANAIGNALGISPARTNPCCSCVMVSRCSSSP